MTFKLQPYWDVYTLCERVPPVPWGTAMDVHVGILTLFACIAAFGLTTFVQAVFDMKTKMQLMRLSHCLGGFFWMLGMTVCSPWVFPLIVGNTYLWGSEPYDNVFSPQMWHVAMWHAQRGAWIHVYWAISSLFLHLWFVGGAAVITLGLERPDWMIFAIAGFSASHFARLFAYEYKDRVASILEMIGIGLLSVCLVLEALNWSNLRGVWLAVSVFERLTHLPTAFRFDANWMRSYDLWLAAVREVPLRPDDIELCTPGSSILQEYRCGDCLRRKSSSMNTVALPVEVTSIALPTDPNPVVLPIEVNTDVLPTTV